MPPATVGDYQNGPGTIYAQHLFQDSALKKHRLGTIRHTDDGREFVYCKATAASIAAGIAVSKVAALVECTIAAADVVYNQIGARKVTVTLTSSPTLNLYEDGLFVLTAGTGLGESYKIRGNTADDDPASGRVTLFLYDALATLHVAASTTVTIYQSPFKSVLINPAVSGAAATTGETIVGVTIRPISSGYYFWAQKKGLCGVMMNASTAGAEANEKQIYAGTTAGFFQVVTSGDMPPLGNTLEQTDLTDGEATAVILNIP